MAEVENKFQAHYEKHPSFHRWCASQDRLKPPHRQKPHKSPKTIKKKSGEPKRDLAGNWEIDEDGSGAPKKIVLIEDLATTVCSMIEHRYAQSGVLKKKVYDELHEASIGVGIEDIDFIVKVYQQLRRSSQADDQKLQRITNTNAHFKAIREGPAVAAFADKINNYDDQQTFYSPLCGIGRHLLNHGSWAEANESDSLADVLLMNEEELSKCLEDGALTKPVLFRSRHWLALRAPQTTDLFLQELKDSYAGCIFSVQRLFERPRTADDISVGAMMGNEILALFESPEAAPINILDLPARDGNLIPVPVVTHCNLMSDMVESSEARIASLVSRIQNGSEDGKVGKRSTAPADRSTDIASCRKFTILGQEGAISGAHCDNMGVCTYITLDHNYNSSSKADMVDPNGDDFTWSADANEVVKLWAVVRTDHLDEEGKSSVFAEFSQHGDSWKPPPSLIRIVPLCAGDTLIMPPMTIHAPMTVTNCLFRGGMFWIDGMMKKSLEGWKFLAKSPHCTNEPTPKQAPIVLQGLQKKILANPTKFGYDLQNYKNEVYDAIMAILHSGDPCACKKKCTRTCPCIANNKPCTPACNKCETNQCRGMVVFDE